MIEKYNNWENSVPDTPYTLNASATIVKRYFHYEPEEEEEDFQQMHYIV